MENKVREELDKENRNSGVKFTRSPSKLKYIYIFNYIYI